MSEQLKQINTTLDEVLRTTGIGAKSASMASALLGLHHRQMPTGLLPSNKDEQGMVFFTRPQLNLTTGNAAAERSFIPLLTTDALSLPRAVRAILDPRLHYLTRQITCPLIDPQQAFIALLTNTCVSCTGIPEPTSDRYTSKPGVYKESYVMTDSVVDKNTPYTINASFKRIDGDPTAMMFRVWHLYQSLLFLGNMVRYPDFTIRQEIDYHTRIYRLVLDKTKRIVTHLYCPAAAFPVTTGLGGIFDFTLDKPYGASTENVDIQFQCMGSYIDDPIIVSQFNKAVGVFNPSMKPNFIKDYMTKIPFELLDYFRDRGYPRINPNSMELEWYLPNAVYQEELVKYNRTTQALGLR